MNDELIRELINSVKNQKRPEMIEVPVYGLYSSKNRTFIYSDDKKSYDYVSEEPNPKQVRNVKAFALSIAEELKRRGNGTGFKATVRINTKGGKFIPDDDFGGYYIEYDRLNSQQWNLITQSLNCPLNHRRFLLILQALKPSIEDAENDFHELFGRFTSLKIIGESQIVSNPIITENGQEQGYCCRYKLEDGTDGEEKFPTGFVLSVPFAKAGEFKYTLNIDLLFVRNDDNELEITMLCPEIEHIEEQAIIDEAAYIKEHTKEYDELLCLSDF